jgi:hypothetical protein
MVTYTAMSVFIDGLRVSMIVNWLLWMAIQVVKRVGVKKKMEEEVEMEGGRVEKAEMLSQVDEYWEALMS